MIFNARFRNAPFCAAVVAMSLLLASCAGKKTKNLTPAELAGKRVVLAEVKGPKDLQTIVEVGIVNEIIDKGRFEIVDRTTTQKALVTYPDPSDWARLGKKLKADYVLSVDAKDSDINEHEGYDRVEEEDSVLAEERGQSSAIGARYVRVKSFEGSVNLHFQFFDVAQGKITFDDVGVAEETVHSREAQMPGKMAFLEKLVTHAVSDFFKKVTR